MRLLLLGQKTAPASRIHVHQGNRRDLAGMGVDSHDKILADTIDNEEAVIVTAVASPRGWA